MPKARLVFIIVFGALAGCATKFDRLQSYNGTDSGYLVASVGKTSDNPMNITRVYFRLKETNDHGYFEYAPKTFRTTSPKMFEAPNGESTLSVKRLPPGEYEIYDYSAGSDYGTLEVWFTKPAALAVPFTVRSSETTYLGQLLVGIRYKKVNLGNQAQGATLELSDQRHRDLAQPSTASLPSKLNFAIPPAASQLPLGVVVTQ